MSTTHTGLKYAAQHRNNVGSDAYTINFGVFTRALPLDGSAIAFGACVITGGWTKGYSNISLVSAHTPITVQAGYWNSIPGYVLGSNASPGPNSIWAVWMMQSAATAGDTGIAVSPVNVTGSGGVTTFAGTGGYWMGWMQSPDDKNNAPALSMGWGEDNTTTATGTRICPGSVGGVSTQGVSGGLILMQAIGEDGATSHVTPATNYTASGMFSPSSDGGEHGDSTYTPFRNFPGKTSTVNPDTFNWEAKTAKSIAFAFAAGLIGDVQAGGMNEADHLSSSIRGSASMASMAYPLSKLNQVPDLSKLRGATANDHSNPAFGGNMQAVAGSAPSKT